MKRQNQKSQHSGQLTQNMLKHPKINRCHYQSGFGLAEVAISVAAGSLLIAGGAVAMRAVNSSMQASSQVTGLRSSASTGLRLLRSETQRSIHLMVKGGTHETGLEHTNFESIDSDYTDACTNLSKNQDEAFKPVFGMQMAQLTTPIIYGLGLSSTKKNYALLRCGPAVSNDGAYETEDVILSRILDSIGIIPCADSSCPAVDNLSNVLDNMETDLPLMSNNQTEPQQFPKPAFAIETDTMRKLLKFQDPTISSDGIAHSFLQPPGNRRDLRVDLNFTAYARADKINRSFSDFTQTDESACDNENGCSFFGIPVNSSKVQLIVDGSGSMSSCIAWANSYGEKERTYYDGTRYKRTRQTCLMTRMKSLQNELTALIEYLSSSTKLSLQAFSSPGYLNHRKWKNGVMVELTDANKTSAINFINSLSDGKVTSWGGTRPWHALDKAFSNAEADTMFFMTDGDPNKDRNGGSWNSDDFEPTAEAYITLNKNRNSELSINTISVGQSSPWLELISNGASGTYRVIN